MKRLQIQHLRLAGLSIRRIAATSGVSARTVERVNAEEPIADPCRHDCEASARVGRPSKMAPFLEQVQSWLDAEPELTTIAIVERLRAEGYQGGQSTAYEAVSKLRPARSGEATVRFEGVPGEFCQHDFGQFLMCYENGSRERIRFFASRLKYSRMTRVRLVENERLETVCHSVVDAYGYFGGMPLIGVFDNPKTIVIKREGKRIFWHETFAWFTTECGFSPHATWPRRPREKGSVENLVGFVKSSFFKAHRFLDRADLEQKLEQWHFRVNEERPSRATGEVPRARMLLEGERLQPMKIDPRGYTLRYSRIVRSDGFVEFDGLRYFAGHAYVGQTLTVRVGESVVLVHTADGEPICHPRIPLNGKYSVLDAQRVELLTKSGARPYIKRQFLMDTCPAAEWFMTEIRHRRPKRWESEVDAIFFLLERHGEEAVREAIIEAARRDVVGSEYIVAILEGQVSEEVGR